MLIIGKQKYLPKYDFSGPLPSCCGTVHSSYWHWSNWYHFYNKHSCEDLVKWLQDDGPKAPTRKQCQNIRSFPTGFLRYSQRGGKLRTAIPLKSNHWSVHLKNENRPFALGKNKWFCLPPKQTKQLSTVYQKADRLWWWPYVGHVQKNSQKNTGRELACSSIQFLIGGGERERNAKKQAFVATFGVAPSPWLILITPFRIEPMQFQGPALNTLLGD